MGTLERIGKIQGAKPLMDKGIEIDESQLDPNEPGLTAVDFRG
jgi:hypothetical protein